MPREIVGLPWGGPLLQLSTDGLALVSVGGRGVAGGVQAGFAAR